jgi:PASTA domain
MEVRMSDIKELLDEAVGSYEPRSDQRAVEERVERRKQRRRLAAGSVALGVFILAGWFAWTAFRPGGATVGSTGSGTYVLSDFEVSAHFEGNLAPKPAEVDPRQADVTFVARWSSNEYPGVHSCTLQVFDPAGAQIGSVSIEMDSMRKESPSSMPLPVTGPIEGATAIGSCGPERLDTPIAYEISDVHLIDDLTVSYVAGWPDSLIEGEYPGTNACTVALFQNGDLVAQKHLTLAVGDQQEVTSTQFNQFNDQLVLVPPSSLDATVVCGPYVGEGVYPDPKPLTDATVPPESGTVLVPDITGLSLEAALGQLESLGLTIRVTLSAAEDIPEGLVASQDPAPGTSVDAGTTVTIIVGEGQVQAWNVLRVTCPASGPPEVRTPLVAAQPDGLHVVVDNRSDAVAVLIRQPSRPWVEWSSGSDGLNDEFVRSVPPGDSLIGCLTNDGTSYPSPTGEQQPNEGAFTVVDDESWASTDLSCGYDESWAFSARGSSSVPVDPDQPDEAVKAFVPGILSTDRVEGGGHPPGVIDELFVRIVRDGALVAWVRAVPRDVGDGSTDWQLNGYACPGSGIG